jgi:hypothetical protein
MHTAKTEATTLIMFKWLIIMDIKQCSLKEIVKILWMHFHLIILHIMSLVISLLNVQVFCPLITTMFVTYVKRQANIVLLEHLYLILAPIFIMIYQYLLSNEMN